MQENTDWYNEKGEVNVNGFYDAVGHFYVERALALADYIIDTTDVESFNQPSRVTQ